MMYCYERNLTNKLYEMCDWKEMGMFYLRAEAVTVLLLFFMAMFYDQW